MVWETVICGMFVVESEVAHKPPLPVVVRNRFSCLTEEDEGEDNAWPVVGKVSNPLSH